MNSFQDQSYVMSDKECKQVVTLYHDTSRASANNLEAAKYILGTAYGQTYKHHHHDIHVNTSTVLNTIATYLTVECEKEIRISNYSSLDKKFKFCIKLYTNIQYKLSFWWCACFQNGAGNFCLSKIIKCQLIMNVARLKQ